MLYHEDLLLLCCLEATMTEFAGSVYELQIDLLQSLPLGMGQQRLPKNMSQGKIGF